MSKKNGNFNTIDIQLLKLASEEFNTDNDKIKKLLKNNANPNVHDGYRSILAISTYHNNYELSQLLLEYGADPDLKVNINSQHATISSFGAFLQACCHNHHKNMQLLLSYGANPNGIWIRKDGNIDYCLTLCMHSAEGIKLLIEHGAMVNVKRNDGTSAITIASTVGNVLGVKYLLDAGADPLITNEFGHNAYNNAANYYSCKNNQKDEIISLIEKKLIEQNISINEELNKDSKRL